MASTSAGSASSPATNVSGTRFGQSYLNDGDAEKYSDHDTDNGSGNHEDGDADSHDEYEATYDNGDYHDVDDAGVIAFGRAASAAETRAITSAVRRYYAIALSGDGVRACSMLMSALARSVVKDYGQAPGPAYMRGGTCKAVMSRFFKHTRAQLTGAFAVTGVRIKGDRGIALLGSTMLPASEIPLMRERGVWKIAALLGGPLR